MTQCVKFLFKRKRVLPYVEMLIANITLDNQINKGFIKILEHVTY